MTIAPKQTGSDANVALKKQAEGKFFNSFHPRDGCWICTEKGAIIDFFVEAFEAENKALKEKQKEWAKAIGGMDFRTKESIYKAIQTRARIWTELESKAPKDDSTEGTK